MGVCCGEPYEVSADKLDAEARLIAEQRKKAKTVKIELDPEKLANDPLSKVSLEKEVEEAFKKYDVDGDGQLNVEEARKYLEDWIKKHAKEGEEVEEIKFEDLDLDGNGYIDREELTQFVFDQRMLHSEVF